MAVNSDGGEGTGRISAEQQVRPWRRSAAYRVIDSTARSTPAAGVLRLAELIEKTGG